MGPCVLNIALTLLLLSFVGTGIAFFAPFWLISLNAHDEHTEGLWGYCPPLQDCLWFYEDDFAIEKTHPVWFKACQVMYTFGFLMQIAVLLMGILHVCCSCCKKSQVINIVVGFVLTGSFLLCVVALSVFGGMAYREEKYKASIHSITFNFDWAFYTGIAAVVIEFFAAVLFLCAGFRQEELEGYERGDVKI